MFSTGDVQGCLRQLETLLRAIKYPGQVDYNGLSKGDPSAFLPIVSFTLTSFSPPFAEQLMSAGLELTGKTDLRFTDAVYKVLRDIFNYKPVLTKQQFLQWGFSQRKISVTCDIINLVLREHNQLRKPRVRLPPTKDPKGEAQPTQTEADTVSKRPFVVNHIENPSTFPLNSARAEEEEEEEEESNESPDLPGDEDEENKPPGRFLFPLLTQRFQSELDERLSAVEAQLEYLLSGLDRMEVVEKRLEDVESQRVTNKAEVVTVSRESWENLMSRVLLLETKAELNHPQINVPAPCQTPAPSSYSSYSSSVSDSLKGDVQEDLKDRLQKITDMLKSTSSLLKNTDSSTTTCK
ncbi:centrosomal protein of 44 kDa [Mugil cephalus]|uniref:centrosomal protein of 44 kDa n=1 Tax=Mugil cephalus TaxID=48193 RepID=UPI001FB7A6BA|nr:centrosomal protein of 44 kDa [Mugil cephalus]